MTTWIERYVEERSSRDPEFKAGYEEECALLALDATMQFAPQPQPSA